MLIPGRYKFWGHEIQSEEPSVHYGEIMASDKGVAAWTAKIVGIYFPYNENVFTDVHSVNTDSAMSMAAPSPLKRRRNSLSA